VQIVDEYTGRVMADRSWERGLHQLVETKEGCKTTGRRETLAQITYQRFFRRYLWLAGMTGTAAEISTELQEVYGLEVVRIPTHRGVQRRNVGVYLCRTAEEKWRKVAAHVRELRKLGRPVLIGTRSVEASEQLSALLNSHGLGHTVLNARQDAEEAAIVAAAGEAGRVTVATNMAGRGN
ncbi:translocase, partial [Mesorhizobium sp. M7A.F.Ca.CA.001.13.2.1]